MDVLLRAAVSSPSVAVIALLRDAGARAAPLRTRGARRCSRCASSARRSAITDAPRRSRRGARGDRLRADVARALLGRRRRRWRRSSAPSRATATSTSSPSSTRGARRSRAAQRRARADGGAARDRREPRTRTSASPRCGCWRRSRPRSATPSSGRARRSRPRSASRTTTPLVIEADAAVRAAPGARGAPREARLAARVGPRRSSRSRGRESPTARTPRRPSLFERAVDLADEPSRAPIERELRAAWDAAGRSAEIEARVQRDAASEAASPAARADHWTEIAERRESRGDKAGAVRALMEACKLDPEPLERWSALERVAEAAGDDVARVAALEAIAMRVGARGRVAVFKRLARAHERRGDIEAAERAWQRVLALDPEDEEADHAVEASIVERGPLRRARRPPGAPRRAAERAVREEGDAARRAAAPGRDPRAAPRARAGRVRRALAAPRRVAEQPGRAAVPGRSARASRRSREGGPALAASRRARDGSRRAATSSSCARVGRRSPRATRRPRWSTRRGSGANGPAHRGRARAARRGGAARSATTSASATRSRRWRRGMPSTRSRGATSSSRRRRRRRARAIPGGALERAMRAAEAAPERATPQLLARALEYRLRGAGAPDEARRTIDDLASHPRGDRGPATRRCARSSSPRRSTSCRAGERGCASSRRRARRSATTRSSASDWPSGSRRWGRPSAAVDEYRVALRGLAPRPAQGAAASRCTRPRRRMRADRDQDAAHFLDLAQTDPDSRAAGAGDAGAPPRARGARRCDGARPPVVDAGPDRRLEELEAAVRVASTPVARAHARARARTLAARARRRRRRRAAPLGGPRRRTRRGGRLARAAPLGRARSRARRRAPATPAGGPRAGRRRPARAAARRRAGRRRPRLRAGGRARPARVRSRARARCRRRRSPPSRSSRGSSRCSRVPRATRPARRSRPSGRARRTSSRAIPATYSIAALERVVPGPTSAVARLYEIALRLLDVPRIPLYLTRADRGAARGAGRAAVAALGRSSAATCAKRGSALRFALGRGLSAAMSHNVLRLGGLADRGRRARRRDARGVRSARRSGAASMRTRLGSRSRSGRPSRPGRSDACRSSSAAGSFPDHPELVARADQSGRRVGMFLAGDFALGRAAARRRVGRARRRWRRRSTRSARSAKSCPRSRICCASP